MVTTFLSHLKFFSNLKSDFNPFVSISVKSNAEYSRCFYARTITVFLNS